MAESQSLMEAKRTLSVRLLGAGVRGRVTARRRTMVMAEATARAGSQVHAVGIGRKIVDEKLTDTVCLCLYVSQ